MVDIFEVSAIVAAAGVLVGVVYYILDMRHQRQERQKDLVIELSSEFKSGEFLEAVVKLFGADYKDYADFARKYGQLYSGNEVPMALMLVSNFFEQVGVLLRNKLIEPSLIDQLVPVYTVWEKVKPLVEDMRKEEHEPKLWEWFEYLYNETKKREKKLQQSKA